MAFDFQGYQPRGDKKNSELFEIYRHKIFERRQQCGLMDLLGEIGALVIQIDHGDGIDYLEELYLMTPMRLKVSFLTDTHKVYILAGDPRFPIYMVMEPLSNSFEDDLTRLNMLYPNARQKPNARYVGEVFSTKDKDETQRLLEEHDIRFHVPAVGQNALFSDSRFSFTQPSDFTGNLVGYSQLDLHDSEALVVGERFELNSAESARLAAADERSDETGLKDLILGVDHMATRILSGEREDAILEFLTLSNYYFWGAYNIKEMNSSTNVNRNPFVKDDKVSPAKVFTANNTPSFVNSFEGLPMPTENFVRNYGRRMHHIAFEVKDGDRGSSGKNVDYVVKTLKGFDKEFLAHVVGECRDEPNLKQIFSKHSPYSILITEYVERCFGFDGFFTKDNVAALTEAAGLDERFEHGHVFD
ncbi:MAG: hypothetical protein AAF530_21200 [Pseudomonadota bacterium]